MSGYDGILGTEQQRKRRAAVLNNPELARKLTAPPLRYAQPEHWNGYVPPQIWQGTANDSPHRRALVAIVSAAEAACGEELL